MTPQIPQVEQWLEQTREEGPRVYSVADPENSTSPQTPPNRPRRESHVNLLSPGSSYPGLLGRLASSIADTKSERSVVDDRGDSERLSKLQDRTDKPPPINLDPRQIERDVSAAGSSWSWLEGIESRIEYDYVPKERPRAMSERLVLGMQTSCQKRRFLPLDCLENIVNEQDVIEEIKHKTKLDGDGQFTEEQLREVAQRVCQPSSLRKDRRDLKRTKTSFQKLFALLVLCNKVAYIFKFVLRHYSDYILPLSWRPHKNPATLPWELFMEKSKDDSQECIDIFDTWDLRDVQRFLDCQWQVHVPYFAWRPGRPHHYIFDREDVLPWIEEKKEDLPPSFIGGFGRVTLVKIHHAHHNLHKHKQPGVEYFAVKTLDNNIDDLERRFRDEVAALRRFSTPDQPHIVMLLATYQWNGLYHFLFPAADGNLEQFWQEFENGTFLMDIGHPWMFTQSLGLVVALSKIHCFKPSDSKAKRRLTAQEQENKNGIHGDIKPRNFLWFKTPPDSAKNEGYPGTLKICDFGLTTFHKDKSMNAIRQEGGSHTYCAPEGFGNTSPKYDIWSIGCVFVEFVTWYLLGYQAVEEFSELRCEEEEIKAAEGSDMIPEDKFYLGQEMKQAVRKWLRKLHSHELCSNAIHDFLQLIEGHMLVPPRSRSPCVYLVEELNKIVDKCNEEGEEYWVTPNPYAPEESPVDLSDGATAVEDIEGFMETVTQAVRMVDSFGIHIVILGLLLWLCWGASRIVRLVTAFQQGELVPAAQ